MRYAMLVLFGSFFALMLGTTVWASLQVSITKIPAEVVGHPWFLATLVDTYLSFLTIFAWVCFRESRWWVKGVWLILFLTLGTMAHAAYVCLALFRMQDGDWEAFFLGAKKQTSSEG